MVERESASGRFVNPLPPTSRAFGKSAGENRLPPGSPSAPGFFYPLPPTRGSGCENQPRVSSLGSISSREDPSQSGGGARDRERRSDQPSERCLRNRENRDRSQLGGCPDDRENRGSRRLGPAGVDALGRSMRHGRDAGRFSRDPSRVGQTGPRGRKRRQR